METTKSISQEELKKLVNNKSQKLKIIDVRSKEEYEQQHIPGAINIPIDQLESFVKNENNESTIITVCRGGGNRSKDGANKCSVNGKDAYYLEQGTLGWFENNKIEV